MHCQSFYRILQPTVPLCLSSNSCAITFDPCEDLPTSFSNLCNETTSRSRALGLVNSNHPNLPVNLWEESNAAFHGNPHLIGFNVNCGVVITAPSSVSGCASGRTPTARKVAMGIQGSVLGHPVYEVSPLWPPKSPTFLRAVARLFRNPAHYARCVSQHRRGPRDAGTTDVTQTEFTRVLWSCPQQGRHLKQKVPLSRSQACYQNTDVLLVQHTKLNNNYCDICVLLHPAAGHVRVFIILLTKLPCFPPSLYKTWLLTRRMVGILLPLRACCLQVRSGDSNPDLQGTAQP